MIETKLRKKIEEEFKKTLRELEEQAKKGI